MSWLAQDRCFVAPFMLCYELEEDFTKDTVVLPLRKKAVDRLCQLLSEDGYTRLVIGDGYCYEIVGVYLEQGKIATTRGEECTVIRDWRCGTKVQFHWTPQNMLDQAEECVEEVEEESCETQWSGTFCSGNYDYTVEDGVITKRELVRKLGEGCYENPVITLGCDGCIAEVADYPTVQPHVGCGCACSSCSCDK